VKLDLISSENTYIKVNSLIADEIKSGIPSNRILLGGFSQGGALALYSSLNTDHKLAGVVALSCWAPLHKQLPGAKQTNKEISYFQAHGDCDPVVPHRWGQMTAHLLKTVLPNHSFKTYKVGITFYITVIAFLCRV